MSQVTRRITGWIDEVLQNSLDTFVSKIENMPRRIKEGVLLVSGALLLSSLVLKNGILAAAAVVVLFSFLFLVRRPIFMVYSTLAVIPVAWVNLLGNRLRVISFMTALSLGYYISRAMIRRRRIKVEPIYVAALVYVAICFLSMFNSVDINFSLTGMKYYLISLAFGLTLIMSIGNPERLRAVVIIVMAWGIGQSLISFAQSAVSPKFYPAYYFDVFGMDIVDSYSVGGIRRASGTFESGPRLAMFLLLPFAYALTFFFRDTLRRRWVWAISLVVLALGLFVSFTRIAILLTAMVFALYYFFEREKTRLVKTMFTVAMLASILFILIQFIFPEEIYRAAGERFTQEGDQLYHDRFYFLYNALMAFTDHPILGWGVKTYTLHSWDFMQKYPVPWRSLSWDVPPLAMPQGVPVHNDYARMLAETGIFSLVAFGILCAMAFHNLLYAVKNAKDAFVEATSVATIIFLAVMLVYWFFHEYYMEEPFVSVLPFALSVILKRLSTNPSAPPVEMSG